jgi:hypothetical protein
MRIMRALWELKAVGTRQIRLREVAQRMPDVARQEILGKSKNLESRGMVTVAGQPDELLALTPLGVAYIRQLQEAPLEGSKRAS